MLKKFSLIAVFIIIFSIFSGCSTSPQKDDKLNIVTTIFPSGDWISEILGDNAEKVNLTVLCDNGLDVHSYQPTADDIIAISTCDVFVYFGGESEEWVEDVLDGAVNEQMVVVNLMQTPDITLFAEESGTEPHEHEGGEHPHDEHIWLSLTRAQTLCDYIAQKLGEADPANADLYKENAKAYSDKLAALDTKYRESLENAVFNTLIFADRFPFKYLLSDYGIEYYAAFEGCSSESEVSFDTIVFLSGKLKELGLKSVITIDGSASNVASAVISSAEGNYTVLELDSMQSVSREDMQTEMTYISVMEENLKTIEKALN